MMPELFKWSATITVIATLTACVFCKEKDYCCPAFDENLDAFIHQEIGDTMVFVSPTQQIRFQVNDKRKTEPYIENCRCNCDCIASGELFLNCLDCDSSRYTDARIIFQRYSDPSSSLQNLNDNYRLTIDFLSFSSYIWDMSDLDTTHEGYIAQLQLNDSTLNNLFSFERDTTEFSLSEVNNNKFLPWKIYVSTKGILGFEDFQTKSTFVYR